MALYVSDRTRWRRMITAVVVAAVLAGTLGVLIGRQQVPSVAEQVQSVKRQAAEVATGVERLDIEYDQVLAGQGDSVKAGVIEPLAGLRARMQTTFDESPWITSARRAEVLDSFAAIEAAANGRVSTDEFTALLKATGLLIRQSFGE
jgi:hypothetical protein